jgi:hypothetical protein
VLASPLRRWFQDPVKIADGHVSEGMTLVEPGPGIGYFTLELARLVGSSGRVVAVDLQPRLLDSLRRRAARSGLADRIDARLATAGPSMGLEDLVGQVDGCGHSRLFMNSPIRRVSSGDCGALLHRNRMVLFAEPAGHVKPEEFDSELRMAVDAVWLLPGGLRSAAARPSACGNLRPRRTNRAELPQCVGGDPAGRGRA